MTHGSKVEPLLPGSASLFETNDWPQLLAVPRLAPWFPLDIDERAGLATCPGVGALQFRQTRSLDFGCLRT